MKRSIFIFLLCWLACQGWAQKDYWHLNNQGGITWTFDNREHMDHIEMSERQMSVVLRYGVKNGDFVCNRGMVWPMLRTVPNDTHASLQRHIEWNPRQAVNVRQRSIDREHVKEISLTDGVMTIVSQMNGLQVIHEITPSTKKTALFENFRLKNISNQKIHLVIDDLHPMMLTHPTEGIYGSYLIEMLIKGAGKFELQPGDSVKYSSCLTAHLPNEKVGKWDAEDEIAQRKAMVRGIQSNLVLVTPNDTLNRMFAFSKIRTLESIFQTHGGPMHSPGGEAYYGGIWANDQAEYAFPFFPFTGYAYGNEAAVNDYMMFAQYINKEYKHIPASIINEGTDHWSVAGDRGDAAMIAYGAARYALASGKIETAKKLWPLVEWCLEYCRRYLNEQGVVKSKSDELEGRFPSGTANLCTSSLYYDALVSASYLAKELGLGKQKADVYLQQSKALRKAIDLYFHANIHGFDTYQYYEGNDKLRAWICMPLVAGIYERAKGTIDALFSARLWTDNGLLTQEGDKTFWDRSTLYALRGTLMAGEIERALDFLQKYSRTRLLGNHVPYAVEAWPEGSQRHLAAESSLYARIYTEGLFGIRPIGLKSFTVSARLPETWNKMELKNICICNSKFDLKVFRQSGKVKVQMISQGRVVATKNAIDNLVFKL